MRRILIALTAVIAVAAAILAPVDTFAQSIQRGNMRSVSGGMLQRRAKAAAKPSDEALRAAVDSLIRMLPEGTIPADAAALHAIPADSLLKMLPDTLQALLPALMAGRTAEQDMATDSLATLLPDSLRTGMIVSGETLSDTDLYDDPLSPGMSAGMAAGGGKHAKARRKALLQQRQIEERSERLRRRQIEADSTGAKKIRQPLFSDSASLSKVCWMAAVMPGYGQIYNKQYWKLPVLYTTLGTSIGLAVHQGSLYKPLRREYDRLTSESMSRTEELNSLQRRMIRANTARQILWGTAAASYIYFLGDAAVNYATNEVSDVKKATTLSLICPGAGQVYNKSYWKVPIVIGGLASMAYVIDWNNRGFQRFKTAYNLRSDFEQNPGKYPDGVSHDEFGGRYSASYLKNLRDAYRRNRDLSILLTIAVYAFQAIDAHVDAHLKDFDVSDDLTVSLEPMFDTTYTQISGTQPAFGFNLNIRF